MILNQKSIEKLRNLINEEAEYRSGPKLVEFFNNLGFDDSYEPGFPSRWKYTDDRLAHINGRPELDRCIRLLFAPVNFIGRYSELDRFIDDFNQYLAFDNWKVVRNGTAINFAKADEIVFKDAPAQEEKEDDFLNREFKEIPLSAIGLDGVIAETLNSRLTEIKHCLKALAPLAVIFLCGSTLEGILLGIAIKYPREFNQSRSAPKDTDGKVKQFHNWTLSNFIDVAAENGLLKEDVKKFSHNLRDFRNYIHPYQQVSSGFNPDIHTARICWQVLKAAINQLVNNKIT